MDDQKVICASTEEGWIEPSKVWVLPLDKEHLVAPLSADGIVFPKPYLPQPIQDAFSSADLTLVLFSPQDLRKHLKMNEGLGVPLAEAPKASLQDLKWVKDLLIPICVHTCYLG